MKKNFVEENLSTVNAYYQSLGEVSEPYKVQHSIIKYRGYLGDDESIYRKLQDIISATDEDGVNKYPRILVIGGTGCGKTTLLAKLCNEFVGFKSMISPNVVQNLQNQFEFNLEPIIGGMRKSKNNISTKKGCSTVYDLANLFTDALQENKSEPSLIVVDEPQELFYAKTYRQEAIKQIRNLERLSSELDNSTVIHITATPDILQVEKYDFIIIFEDIDRMPIADKLDIIENDSKLSFDDGMITLVIDIVKNKKEKALVEIQSVYIINKIKDTLNSIGITTVSLSSKDKDASKTYVNPKTGKLEVTSENDMYKAIIEDSCLPKFTLSGEPIDVYLTTSIIGQGTSIKGIIDKDGFIDKDVNLVPVYTVKDKSTCSIDFAMQFLARIRYHVNRAIVFVNKESYDAKIQKIISQVGEMSEVSIYLTKTGNYHLTTLSKKLWKVLKNACKDLDLNYKTYVDKEKYSVAIFIPKFESLAHIMKRHIHTAKENLMRFSLTYDTCDGINDDIDLLNGKIDIILGLYTINGIKNSLNIIKRNKELLFIDKEALWLNIYLEYTGQYYYCNDLFYQELSIHLEMPIYVSQLKKSDIDLDTLNQQYQKNVYETLNNAKINHQDFKEKILKNTIPDDIKWLSNSKEFIYLSSLTKLTNDLDYAYDIISSNDINVVKDIYDNELRKKLSSLSSPDRRILEAYALTKEDEQFLDDIAKLIIASKYWQQVKRGIKLGVNIDTLCYQFGKAKSYNEAKNYVDKTQTVQLLRKHSLKELESFGRVGMEILITLNMFYDINKNTFIENRKKVTKKDLDNLRVALNENKIIKSLQYDTSGIGKSGAKYTKKDADNLISCIFVLDDNLSEKDLSSGVIYKLLRIAKSAR